MSKRAPLKQKMKVIDIKFFWLRKYQKVPRIYETLYPALFKRHEPHTHTRHLNLTFPTSTANILMF